MFTDVKVPKENRIGDDGLDLSLPCKLFLEAELNSAQALGIASEH